MKVATTTGLVAEFNSPSCCSVIAFPPPTICARSSYSPHPPIANSTFSQHIGSFTRPISLRCLFCFCAIWLKENVWNGEYVFPVWV
jgi:hypothetical protein